MLIVPTMVEAAGNEYSRYTEMYINLLSAEGFNVVETITELDADDYWAHDGHFNPKGARVFAEKFLEAIESR